MKTFKKYRFLNQKNILASVYKSFCKKTEGKTTECLQYKNKSIFKVTISLQRFHEISKVNRTIK